MPEGSEPLQLKVGDRVVYPNQGVCRVTAIDVKEVAGQRLTFVTLRREEDGAVVMVPSNKVTTIGVRKVATAEDVESIFEFLRSDSDKADLDWKQRARTNLDRMTQGGILGLTQSISSLARILGPFVGLMIFERHVTMPYYAAAGLILAGGLLVLAAAATGKDFSTAEHEAPAH